MRWQIVHGTVKAVRKGLDGKKGADTKPAANKANPQAQRASGEKRRLSATVYSETEGVYSEVSASASTSRHDKAGAQPGGAKAAGGRR